VDRYHQNIHEGMASHSTDTISKDITTSTNSITQSLQQMMRGSLSLG
jgi:hypothetical protein